MWRKRLRVLTASAMFGLLTLPVLARSGNPVAPAPPLPPAQEETIAVPGGQAFVRAALGLPAPVGLRLGFDDLLPQMAEALSDPALASRAERLERFLDELDALRDRLAELDGMYAGVLPSLAASGAAYRKAEALLAFFGLRLTTERGLDLERVGGARESLRRDLLGYLGLPLSRVARRWAAGETIEIVVDEGMEPLLLGVATWENILGRSLAGGEAFGVFVRDARARALLLGLAQLDSPTQTLVLSTIGPVRLYEDDELRSGLLQLAPYLRASGGGSAGTLKLHGGDIDAWSAALGLPSAGTTSSILGALLARSHRPAAHLWRALTLTPPARAHYLLTLGAPSPEERAAWARRLVASIRLPPENNASEWIRWPGDLADLFADLRLRNDGRGLAWPGGAGVWLGSGNSAASTASNDALLIERLASGSAAQLGPAGAIRRFLEGSAATRYQPEATAAAALAALISHPELSQALGFLTLPIPLAPQTAAAFARHVGAVATIGHDETRIHSTRQLQATLLLVHRLMLNETIARDRVDGVLRALFDLEMDGQGTNVPSSRDDRNAARGYGTRLAEWYRLQLSPRVAEGLLALGWDPDEEARRHVIRAGLIGGISEQSIEVDGIPYTYSPARVLGEQLSTHVGTQHVPAVEHLLELDALAASAPGDAASAADRVLELLDEVRQAVPPTAVRGDLDEALAVPIARPELFARGESFAAALRAGGYDADVGTRLRYAASSWLGDALVGLVYGLHLGNSEDPFGEHRHVVWPHVVEPQSIPGDARQWVGAWQSTAETWHETEGAILRNSLMGVPASLGRWNLQSAALARGGAKLDETVDETWGATIGFLHYGSLDAAVQSYVARMHEIGRSWVDAAIEARNPELPAPGSDAGAGNLAADGGGSSNGAKLREALYRVYRPHQAQALIDAITSGNRFAASGLLTPGNLYFLGRLADNTPLDNNAELRWKLDQMIGMPAGRRGEYLGLREPPMVPYGEAGHSVADPALYSRLFDVRVALAVQLEDQGLPPTLQARLLPEAMGAALGATRSTGAAMWRDLLAGTVAAVGAESVRNWVVDLAFDDELNPDDPAAFARLAATSERRTRGVGTSGAAGLRLPGPSDGFQEVPTFASVVEIVALDAGVWDSSDRFVTDLSADDFTIEIEGQTVTPSFVRLEGSTAPTAFLDPLAPGVTESVAPVRRNFVIVADLLTTSSSDWTGMLDEAVDFVANGLAPDDLVAVVEVGATRTFRIVTGFTDNHTLIAESLERLRGNAFDSSSHYLEQIVRDVGGELCRNDGCPIGDCGSNQCTPQPAGRFSNCFTSCSDWEELKIRSARTLARTFVMQEAARGTELVRALTELATALVDGDPTNRPKTWVLLSGGFELRAGSTAQSIIEQYSLQQALDFRGTINLTSTDLRTEVAALTESLRRCRCSVYTVDTIGGGGLVGADMEASFFAGRAFATEARLSLQGPLNSLARDTGGIPFLGGTDFSQAFEQILRDTRMRYVIGIDPTTLGLGDPETAESRWRSARIRVTRRGVTVRAREGFYWPRATATGDE